MREVVVYRRSIIYNIIASLQEMLVSLQDELSVLKSKLALDKFNKN